MLTLIVGLLALFGLGSCFALLGSISLKLMPRLGIDSAKFGTLVLGMMSAAMVSSLIVGVVLDTIGFKTVSIAGFVAVTTVILLLAYSKNFSGAFLAAVLLGIAAMMLNAAGNTMTPILLRDQGLDEASASNLGNVAFGIGLFVTPLLTSTLFKKTTYEMAVSSLAVIMGLGAVLAIVATEYPQASGSFTIGQAFGLLANPVVLLAGLLLFCYMSLETSFSNWLASFGKEVIRKENTSISESDADARAAGMLTVFAVAMMLGRLAAGIIPAAIGVDLTAVGPYLLAAVAILSAATVYVMTQTNNTGMARTLAFAGGFLFAPIFPTTVGVTFSKIPQEVYGSAFGIIFAVGLIGSSIIPKMIGNKAQGSTVQKSLRLLIPLCIILAAIAVALGFIGNPE